MTPPWLRDDGPTVMGIVNVNDDSFSDPRTEAGDPVAEGAAAVAAGAVAVDVGAQSAALDAARIPPRRQAEMLAPVVAALTARDVTVCVDAHEPAPVRAGLLAGAAIVNDFSGNADPAVVDLVAEAGAAYVLTHNPLGPRRRQTDPDAYGDVVDAVLAFFDDAVAALVDRGVATGQILLDPGVDVSKTPAQTLALLRGLPRLRSALELPLLLAVSRKDVLGVITGRAPAERDPATHALVGRLSALPRTVLRVHDVAGAVDALAVAAALDGRRHIPEDRLLDDGLRRQG